jgi:hypothetical protein
MARKSSAGGGLIVILVAGLAAVSAVLKWADENRLAVAALVLVIVAFFLGRSWLRKKAWQTRFASLAQRYGSEEVAEKIMNRMFWEGQTEEQLRESIGQPVAVDSQVMKTKTKEIWKYHEARKGQFLLRITLEKGKVVGWENKS